MKRKNRQKGFTLIEILVVVVIIAVLAALILPRFLSQSEAGFIAEAQQTLGVLRRAYANAEDMGVTVASLTAAQTPVDASMRPYGLKGIPATNYTYACTAAGAPATLTSCVATRVGDATKTITLSSAGAFSCGAGYSLISAQKGCKA